MVHPDGTTAPPLGEWLQQHNLDIRGGQVYKLSERPPLPLLEVPVSVGGRVGGGGSGVGGGRTREPLLSYMKVPPMHQYVVCWTLLDISGTCGVLNICVL